MKKKRQTLFLLVNLSLIIILAVFSPGTREYLSAMADSGATEHMFIPAVMQDPSPTPTITPTLEPTPDGRMPLTSTSLYVRSLSAATAYNLGCDLGTRDLTTPGRQDSVVVLAFASPQKKNGAFGAYTYVPGTDFVPVEQIASVVQWFGYGYWYCVGDDFESHLSVGIGTSNYPANSTSSVTYEHGQAWAQMVKNVEIWFTGGNDCPRGCDGQVNALGANDIELAWNTPANSSRWVQGYGSVENAKPLINFGALEGCPTFANPGAHCAWPYDDVLEVTAYPFIHALPEIYLIDGRNAQQWYLMSKYAANSVKFARPFNILGPLTQYQACVQVGGCTATKNSPEKAWEQLYPLIQNDPQTRVKMGFSSDMKWGVKETPVPSSSQRPAGSARQNWPKPLSIAVPPQEPPVDLLSLPPRIVDTSKAIIHSWEIDLRNAWEGAFGGEYLYVLAGASPEDPDQGLIIVDTNDPATGAVSRGVFPAEKNIGPLRILAVSGSQVSLSTSAGEVISFDLATRQYR